MTHLDIKLYPLDEFQSYLSIAYLNMVKFYVSYGYLLYYAYWLNIERATVLSYYIYIPSMLNYYDKAT